MLCLGAMSEKGWRSGDNFHKVPLLGAMSGLWWLSGRSGSGGSDSSQR